MKITGFIRCIFWLALKIKYLVHGIFFRFAYRVYHPDVGIELSTSPTYLGSSHGP